MILRPLYPLSVFDVSWDVLLNIVRANVPPVDADPIHPHRNSIETTQSPIIPIPKAPRQLVQTLFSASWLRIPANAATEG